MATKKLNIGLVGGGVVGGGVYEILSARRKELLSLGADIVVSKICVKNLSKKRDYKIENSTKLVSDFRAILNDPDINCVVELMGGVGDAKTVVFESIASGKHVVTANKALIAAYLPQLTDLLKRNPTVKFGYEAAVCGGAWNLTCTMAALLPCKLICVSKTNYPNLRNMQMTVPYGKGIPIIDTLRRAFTGDEVEQVAGIMNGTTNYILTKMDKEQADYQVVLKDAQAKGFAEADPTADVEGHDVQAKIAILTKLAFGVNVPLSQIPTLGISRIQRVDFEYAQMLQCTIKLLGISRKISPDTVTVYVSPTLVPLTNDIANVGGAKNIVNVESKYLESSSFVGLGAGRYPTANSVVSDILHIARNHIMEPFALQAELNINDDYSSRFYLRLRIKDQLGIIRRVGEIAEKCDVSIYSVLQNRIEDPSNVHFVVETELTKLSNAKKMGELISQEPWSLEAPLVLPFLAH